MNFFKYGGAIMIIEKVGSRGIFFTFETGDAPINGNTSIYLINTENKIFLCDTHMGPKSMKYVKEYIHTHGLSNKEIIVFNSHADWDHIWGNFVFKDSTIIAHELCRKRMQQEGGFDLKRKKKYHNGTIKELKLPNLTFSNKLNFEEYEIEFVYAPGHTIDSAICIDRKDSVVFVGDLLEYPIPFINHYDIGGFLKSLELIKKLSSKVILSAHSGIIDEKLFNDNIEYIKNLLLKKQIHPKDEDYMNYHNYNYKNILMSKHEYIAREKLEEKFDFESFRRDFWSSIDSKYDNLDFEFVYLRDITYETLEEALKKFILRL